MKTREELKFTFSLILQDIDPEDINMEEIDISLDENGNINMKEINLSEIDPNNEFQILMDAFQMEDTESIGKVALMTYINVELIPDFVAEKMAEFETLGQLIDYVIEHQVKQE